MVFICKISTVIIPKKKFYIYLPNLTDLLLLKTPNVNVCDAFYSVTYFAIIKLFYLIFNLQVINAVIKRKYTSSDLELCSLINHSQRFLPALE